MKFPYSMLRDYVETTLSAEEVGDLLTMAGFELEGIEELDGDSVLDIKVMSNRGDGLSVFGLAREVLAKDPKASAKKAYADAESRFASYDLGNDAPNTSIQILVPECFRYACVILEGVGNAVTPEWLRHRLVQSGMRPISLLVDVTNYVMLELGQPLHAFDFDKLSGHRIVVRSAVAGEKLTTLDGKDHVLEPGHMMICDSEKPVAVAGVMGGQDSEVSSTTTRVLLESAHFKNTSVRKTRKQLGLNTEASYRFERSVDPEGVVAAIIRCVQLVLSAAPSLVVSQVLDVYPGRREPSVVQLRPSRASRMLGMAITSEQTERYLSRLGFQLSKTGDDTFDVVSPSWRPDIVREIDLVEELGRVHGFELIPETLIQGTSKMGGPQLFELWTDLHREAALRCGLNQIISHSLRDQHLLDLPGAARVGPRVPASPDTAFLRNSLLPCLSDAARRNNHKEIQIFEMGKVFSAVTPGYRENYRFGVLLCGPVTPTYWSRGKADEATFFTLKGFIEEILGAVGVSVILETTQPLDTRLHPTRQAALTSNGVILGVIGQIHPDVASGCGLSPDTLLAEYDLEDAYASRSGSLNLESVSKHPAVQRDISVLVSSRVPYTKISQAVANGAGAVLEKQWLFDVFTGQGIAEGMLALGISMQLRKPDSTFTDEEANLVRDQVVKELAELGANMR